MKQISFYALRRVTSTVNRIKQNNSNNPHAHQYAGFTMIEVMLASILLLIVFAGIIQSFRGSILVSNRAAARDALEAAVSEDLSWIRDYSKIWHCQNGPYALAPANTNNGCQAPGSALSYLPPFNSSPTSRYQKFRDWCQNNTISTQFLTEGATTTVPPSRPNAFQQASITITPSLAQGASINRTISVTGPNRLRITYQTPNTSAVQVVRQTSVFIEAAAWCP